MHDADYYKKLGFRCGLEIHQRLATEHKLFCSCSTSSASDKIIAKVERRQRAVAGELGKVDRSTKFESGKGRNFVYNVFEKSSCLIDLDEEPPKNVNPEAVEAALRLSSVFNVKIPDEIEPMRKGVVDGSDPSAFQRSMIIGYDGSIEVEGKKIRITSIFLEEESSGIESQNTDSVTYNVDRLGLPLIEIDTDPDITTPKEAKDVALKIGSLIRLTGKRVGDSVRSEVQRGIGTIRQDVNVSIEGGTRVEVKGLQQIDGVDLIIENEVERQVRLLEIKKMLLAKGAKVGEAKDITKLLGSTEAKMVKEALKQGHVVMGVGLYGFGGFVGKEIGANRRLGSEISDYAKMSGVKGIIHSDEDLSKYGFNQKEVEAIQKEFKLGRDDAFMMVTAQKEMCERAIDYAISRAQMAITEVPPETRAVLDADKGTTRFMRPLPQGERMYPETDTEPIEIDPKYYKKIIDETIYTDERVARIRKEIPNAQLAEQLIGSPKLAQYEYIAANTKCDRLVIATTILERVKEIERSGVVVNIDDDVFVDIFNRYVKGELTKAGIVEVVKALPKSKKDVDNAIKKGGLERLTGTKLKEIVKNAKAKEKGEILREVMTQYRLSVDGDELRSIVGM